MSPHHKDRARQARANQPTSTLTLLPSQLGYTYPIFQPDHSHPCNSTQASLHRRHRNNNGNNSSSKNNSSNTPRPTGTRRQPAASAARTTGGSRPSYSSGPPAGGPPPPRARTFAPPRCPACGTPSRDAAEEEIGTEIPTRTVRAKLGDIFSEGERRAYGASLTTCAQETSMLRMNKPF